MNTIAENMHASMQVELMYLSAINERISHSKPMWPLQGNAGCCKFIASLDNYCTSTWKKKQIPS